MLTIHVVINFSLIQSKVFEKRIVRKPKNPLIIFQYNLSIAGSAWTIYGRFDTEESTLQRVSYLL